MAYYDRKSLESLGFKKLGLNVQISDKASLYGVENISIGDNVRIDDFCVLSASSNGIDIGNHVHIAIFSSLIGQGNITLSDFSGLSGRVSIYSSTDDYSGNFLTNPTVPVEYLNVKSEPVLLEKHVIVGCGSVIMPGVTIGTGASIGALSLIARDCKEFGVYAGNPARHMMNRSTDLLALEQQLLISRG